MTGMEHFRVAEKMLVDAGINSKDRATPGWYTRDELIAAAQVHAMLALAMLATGEEDNR